MRGKAHSEEVRAQVIASLLAGQGVMEVASQYNIDASVVSRWKNAIPNDQLQVLATKKGEQIEQLLFDYLITTLQALRNQSEIAGEREYVIKQPASDFAVLHGVMADKSVRLLEAIHRANNRRLPEPEPPTIG